MGNIVEEIRDLTDRANTETWQSFGRTLETLVELRSCLDVAITAIWERNQLRAERDYWKDRYDELLRDDIKHSETMMGNVLAALIEKDRAQSGEA